MPKKGLLGCSFPLVIGIAVIALVMFIIGFLAGPIGQSVLPGLHESMPGWLKIEQPHIALPPEPIFHIMGFAVTNSIIAAWITIVVLVGISYLAFRRPKLVPGKFQNFVEWVLSYIYNLCRNVAGEKNGRIFFPLVATIFLMVIANSWLSLIPGYGSITVREGEEVVPLLRGANTDINMPLALALFSFIFVTYFGLKHHRFHYIREFLNFGSLLNGFKLLFTGKAKQGLAGIFNGVIAAFVGILELLSQFIRIVSFTFRLFGNMTAGEILLVMISFLLPFMVSPIFYGLEFFVGFVQALIFGGLTLVFLTVAAAPHEKEASES